MSSGAPGSLYMERKQIGQPRVPFPTVADAPPRHRHSLIVVVIVVTSHEARVEREVGMGVGHCEKNGVETPAYIGLPSRNPKHWMATQYPGTNEESVSIFGVT